jgi:methylmalonyl-CoA mutase cobalamin-binding subunit
MLVAMGQPDHDAAEDVTAMLAAVGIEVTEEGKARARARLAEADAQRTPERRAAWRAQMGLPPAEAA